MTIENPRLCGVKHFHLLDNTRYLVFLFRADAYSGELCSSSEGAVKWIPLANVEEYTWIPDFEDLLKIFLDDEISELFYFRDERKLNRVFL